MRSLAAGILLLLCAGCMPMVAHGPRVEPGATFAVTGSLTAGPRYSTYDWGNQPFLSGPVGVSAGHGQASPSPNSVGTYVGVSVPVPAFPLAQADLYLQLPPAWLGDLDVGAGVNAGAFQAMPYVQLGRMGEDGSGWYTTQGIAFQRATGEATNTVRGWAWLSTAAYQWRGATRTTHVFVTAGAGQEYGNCYHQCGPAEHRLALAAGAMLQFHRRRPAP